ncbi:hypothetical protein J7E88_28310 [Streptomyces sp. ISL-10]|uniref:hypothetical protein n=1 Tax=Streptomyces sp. ISL-10 TaxID=2819172 RepID=UPI001BE7E502|nr:hypothetical protein [Streptomyces sp. ISL-10]MBT2369113.1 hypothetical protein [Streptomyces sp. ISL-10]
MNSATKNAGQSGHAGRTGHAENIDHDAVLRARTALLGSGRLSLRQEADACRTLSVVSPLAYLPRLVRALLSLSYELGAHPQTCLSVCAEAAEAARRLDAMEPGGRAELLVDALGAYERQLYVLGRRAEGLSVREEMARAGRRAFQTGQVESPVYGLGPLATALAEEGRHREAAELCGRIVAAARREGSGRGPSFWDMVAWAAELDAAGLHEEALDAFGELVSTSRREVEDGRTSLANLLWKLVRFAEMLDSHGRFDDARAARREAGELFTELAASGERKSWSCILAWWRTCWDCRDAYTSRRSRAKRSCRSDPTRSTGLRASGRRTSTAGRTSRRSPPRSRHRPAPIRVTAWRSWSSCIGG